MAGSFRHHLVGGGKGGNHEDMVAQQSKDAIVYVTVSISWHQCNGLIGLILRTALIMVLIKIYLVDNAWSSILKIQRLR